jgi:hypothetical protein
MIEFIILAIAVPFVVMVWVAAAAVCHMAWKDFFHD